MADVYRISDPAVLKAVAHPVRVRLLGALRTDGPATATELAARFGESSGSTSYHLRQLARFGFVEEVPEPRDRRERRWRSVHRYTSWSNSELAATPEGREATLFMRQRQIDVLVGHWRDFESAEWPVEWLDAAGMSDDSVRLRPSTLAELHDRFAELVREMAEHDADAPGAEVVAVSMAAFPVRRPT
ncbi:helix-turn-helix transcriptional regulator [Streptosporangiaceae bacterium NEAU-GS5]|nr:helix-turn-helix transcriptional regulator [Streptosporangiaceae bacterium NEAU-GS5]